MKGRNDIQKLLPMHAQLLRVLAQLLEGNPDRASGVVADLRKEASELEAMADWQDLEGPVCLYSESISGNLHEATRYVNKLDVAKYVLQIEGITGGSSIVVLRLPKTHKLVVERAERVARYAKEQQARKGRRDE